MKLFGIPLRKPSFGEITASAVMGIGIWLAVVGMWRATPFGVDRFDAGALLLVILWGCVCARIGIHVSRGARHLAVNFLVSGALLGVYQMAWAIM